jgi:hypothetical protein
MSMGGKQRQGGEKEPPVRRERFGSPEHVAGLRSKPGTCGGNTLAKKNCVATEWDASARYARWSGGPDRDTFFCLGLDANGPEWTVFVGQMHWPARDALRIASGRSDLSCFPAPSA